MRKLDVLQELIEDETVTEIMGNWSGSDLCGAGRKTTRWTKGLHVRREAGRCDSADRRECNRVVNESMPIVDARLENGARVDAVVRPVALNGPI